MPAEIDFTKIGKRIRNLRRERNMTQEELAHICDYSISQISAVETGERAPSLDLIILIANALGQTLDYFIADTPYVCKDYLVKSSLAPKLDACTTEELLMVEQFIDQLLKYKESILSTQ